MEEKIKEIIKYGKKYGEVEVFAVVNSSKDIHFKDKKINRVTDNKSQVFMIRIVNGNRYGFSTFNTNWKKALREAVKNMKYNTKLKVEVGLPKKGKRNLKLTSKIKGYSHDELLEFGKILNDSKYIIPNSEVGIDFSKVYYGNKNEIESYEKNIMNTEIEMKHGNSIIYNFDEDINEVNVEKIKNETEELSKKMEKRKKIDSKRYDIIFKKDAKIELINTLLKFFNGNIIYSGINTIYKNKGKEIFSPKLSIEIDSLKKMSGSYPFDAEGNKGNKKLLIDHGKVSGFTVDRYLSNILKEKKPFNSSDLRIPSELKTGNIILEKQKEEIEEDGIKLYTAMGWHTVDLGNGNASISVDNALLNKNGKEIAIKGGMISFNIFEAFRNLEIGNKYERIGNFLFPDIKIKKIQFTS